MDPVATAAAPNTEPQINDDLPPGAEVVDSDYLNTLLNRAGLGPELVEEPVVPPAPPTEPQPQAGKPAVQPAGEPEPVAPDAPPAVPAPAAPPSPTGFTPEQETLIAQRLEATRKEFEPLTSERDAALAQVEELTAKLQAVTSPAPVPRDIDPLLLEDDFNAIDKQERDAENLLAWCDEHEDNGFTPKEEGERVWTPADIRKLRRNVEKQINQTLPAARNLVQARATNRAEARKVYPAMFDPKSEDYKIRQGFYRQAPWIKAVFPQFDLWLGDMMAGHKLRLGNKALRPDATTPPAKPASTLPKPPTPPVLPSPGGAPLSTTGAKPKAAGIDSNEFVARGGTRGALVDLIRQSGI